MLLFPNIPSSLIQRKVRRKSPSRHKMLCWITLRTPSRIPQNHVRVGFSKHPLTTQRR